MGVVKVVLKIVLKSVLQLLLLSEYYKSEECACGPVHTIL